MRAAVSDDQPVLLVFARARIPWTALVGMMTGEEVSEGKI